MYSEDAAYRERFNWKDFLGRVILVLLFVFLLMWLFPMPNIDKLGDKVDNLENKVTILTDRIYAENLEKLTNVATNYFTISRLPKEVNGKVTLTLDEMLKKKLILDFKDKDGNSCDRNKSYVEIIRKDKEYEVKTVLTCGEVSDYVISYMNLECNLSCDNSCTLKEKVPNVEPTVTPSKPGKSNPTTYTIYQYSRTTEIGKWTEWSKWTTDTVTGDQIEKKLEYTGKKWISKPVYSYEYTRTVTTPGDCYEETVKGECKDVKKLVSAGQSKTCTREYQDEENYCVDKRQRYVVGTYYGRECSTCAVKLMYKYAYKTVQDCSNTRPVTKTERYDCSTSDVYTTVKECEPDTTKRVCGSASSKTETVWSEKTSLDGYTKTGNKKVVRDEGHYEYTSWVVTIPEGYEKDQTRTLYRYRNYVVTRNTEYKWDSNPNLGDGWIRTGKTQTVTK